MSEKCTCAYQGVRMLVLESILPFVLLSVQEFALNWYTLVISKAKRHDVGGACGVVCDRARLFAESPFWTKMTKNRQK